MLTEQNIYEAQQKVSENSIIQSIEKDYPNLYYLVIFGNNNFEELPSEKLDTIFYIANNDTKGASWILEVTKWLLNVPFVVQKNKDAILALDLAQLNYNRLYQLFFNLDSLKDRDINTEVNNYLNLLKFDYKNHYYLRLGQ